MKKVIWAEGTILSQQHLQQYEKWLRHICQSHEALYGFLDLSVEIQQGCACLEKAKGYFGEGEYFEVNEGLAYDLSQIQDSAAQLYLGRVKEESIDILPGYHMPKKKTRWKHVFLDTQDDYDADRSREILYGDPQYYLHHELSEMSNMITIPLCRVMRDPVWRIEEKKIPPLLNLQAWPYAIQKIKQQLQWIQSENINQSFRRVMEFNLQKPCHPDVYVQEFLRAYDGKGDLSFLLENGLSIIQKTLKKENNKFLSLEPYDQMIKKLVLLQKYDKIFLKCDASLQPFISQIKIAPLSKIHRLIQSSLSGMPLMRSQKKIDDHSLCFECSGSTEEWETIYQDKALAIFLPGSLYTSDISAIGICK